MSCLLLPTFRDCEMPCVAIEFGLSQFQSLWSTGVNILTGGDKHDPLQIGKVVRIECNALSVLVKSELSPLMYWLLLTCDQFIMYWERPDSHDRRSATSAKQAMARPNSCLINISSPVASGSTR